MKKLTLTVLTALTALTVAQATQYSCLSIITETKKIGKWAALKSWIEAAGLKDEWEKCAYVSDDYPQFASVTNALTVAGIFDEDEIRALMTATKDEAVPEKLIRRIYDRDTRTASGRTKWHGRQTAQIVDTNAWTRTTIYEDGTRFTDRAAPPAKRTVRPTVAMTNGVPARLAAARVRWTDAKNNGNTTTANITLRAGQ